MKINLKITFVPQEDIAILLIKDEISSTLLDEAASSTKFSGTTWIPADFASIIFPLHFSTSSKRKRHGMMTKVFLKV